jgi:hypothetical protein
MKWVEVMLILNQKALTAARVTAAIIILWHSVCRTLPSDQGQSSMSNLVKEVCKLLGANKVRKTPYHPATEAALKIFTRHFIMGRTVSWKEQKETRAGM